MPVQDDEERLIHFHDVYVSEDPMDAWMRWYGRNKGAVPMPSIYESPPKFVGGGGYDGTFIAGYAIRNSVVRYPR